MVLQLLPALIGGAAALGGAAMSSSAASKAAKQSAAASQYATDQAMKLQREQMANTEAELRPYVRGGEDATAAARRLLGLPEGPSGSTDWNAYVNAAGNEDVRAIQDIIEGRATGDEGQMAFLRGYQQDGQPRGESLGEYHYRVAGQGFGRQLPGGASSGPSATAPAGVNSAAQGFETSAYGTRVKDAQASFEDSPWFEFMQTETGRAVDDLDTKYGASGMLLSGGATRARAEIAARLKGEAFDRHLGERDAGLNAYTSGLSSLADTGFRASSGIASGGAQFANSASALLMDNAQTQGQAAQGAAQAKQGAISDAVGIGGWLLGQTGNNNPSTTPTTRSPSALVTAPSVLPRQVFS